MKNAKVRKPKDRFKVLARYGLERSVELVDKDSGIFRMWGLSHYCRGADGMYDFEGGPMLSVGEDFYGHGLIKALSHVVPPGDESFKREPGFGLVYVYVDMKKKGKKGTDG